MELERLFKAWGVGMECLVCQSILLSHGRPDKFVSFMVCRRALGLLMKRQFLKCVTALVNG